MNDKKAPTSEAPEIRDAEEIDEDRIRRGVSMVIGTDGRPMSRIACTVSDKVPTVQFGNVVVGPVTIERYVDDLGDGLEGRQHRIDRAREIMRDAEFVCGVERRLLQWALDPASRVQSPVNAEDAFASPPAGYDPSKTADPRQPDVSPPPPGPGEPPDSASADPSAVTLG